MLTAPINSSFSRFFIAFLIILLSHARSMGRPDTLTYAAIPHEEIIPGGTTNFSLFDDAFYRNQLFLLGESHGVQKPQEVDFELLKHLNQRLGIRYYLAEVDASKAYYLNQFLQTGDESTLMNVFRSWIAASAQWANKDFVRKIQVIRSLNQTLPDNRRIRFIGIDRIQDKALAADHLTVLLRGHKLPKTTRSFADSLVTRLRANEPDSLAAGVALAWLANWPAHAKHFGTSADELHRFLTNVGYLKTDKGRESIIFSNFKAVLPGLNNEKLYGFWGFFHVLQAPVKGGNKAFACRIRESDLYLRNQVVSITFNYLDSYSMVPTAYLPPFWQDKGKTYSRLNKFNNDSELMRSEGINAMRAVTRPNSLTLFALDRAGSFARQTPIRITYSPFMPQKLEFDPNHVMTDYYQYVILVRNSDMTEPLVP